MVRPCCDIERFLDLAAGRESESLLLVTMAASRLRSVGIDLLPVAGAGASHRLYAQLAEHLPGSSRRARGEVRIYLTGGSTAVLEGWREATVDVDLRFRT